MEVCNILSCLWPNHEERFSGSGRLLPFDRCQYLLSNDARNVKFKEDKGYYADTSALSMFGIQLLQGNAKTVLDAPDKILLSENTAKKFFGNENALGKRLTDRNPDYTRTYEVTGVFKEMPHNSHLIISHLLSYSTLGSILRFYGDTSNATETSFGWYDFYNYLKLKPGADYKKLEAKFPAFCDKYMNNGEWQKTNNVRTEIHAIPLSDIHLYSNYNQEAEVNGNGQSVSFLFMIAFFIVAIAWINYINLATARSMERAREVGVRKVVGALRSNLIRQFLVESFLLNLSAFVLGLAAVYLLTPWFNAFTGRDAQNIFYLPANYWLGFSAMFLLGSFLSGIYPAFVLSSFQPVKVLKGLFKNSSSGLILRKSLIIVQFATSVVLIAGTIIVYQQVSYMQQQNLGVNIDQTLILKGAESVTDSSYQSVYQPFKTALLKIPGIKNVSSSSNIMGEEIYWTNGSRQLTPNSKSVTLYNLGIDYDFIPSYSLKLVAGRNFSKDFTSDEHAVLLNEEAAKLLGFTDFGKAVNQSFFSAGDTVKLAGIVANYHQEGLQKTIPPMIFV
jgi:putative ABC transport system permease protein